MAYKFRLGSATLSGSLVQEGDLFVSSSDSAESARNLDVQGSIKLDGTQVFNTDRDLVNLVDVDGTGDLTMGTITMTGFAVDADGDTALKSLKVDDGSTIGPDSIGDMITLAGGGDITIKDGAYDFNIAAHDGSNGLKLGGVLVSSTAAELNYVDVASIGTVEASKAVVVDSNKDASGFRNVGAVQLTTSGRVIVDDATEATSTTDGSLQTDGGLSVAKSAVIGDDLDLLSDAALLNFGADKDVSLTHVADTGLLLNSSRQLQFGDSGTYIHQSADGVLDLVADSEIEINATTIDINGAVDASSTITAAGRVIVDDATEATSTTDGSLQTDGGLSVAKSAVIGDDLDLLSDAAILNFGADKDVNLTHVADTGLLLNSSMQLQFRDSTEYINSDADGYLNVRGQTGVDLNINGTDVLRVASSGITATSAKVSDLTQGRLVTAGASGELEDQAALFYDDDRSGMNGYLSLNVSSSASGSVVVGDGLLYVADQDERDVLVASSGSIDFGWVDSSEESLFTFGIADEGDLGNFTLRSDEATIYFGADTEVELMHVHNEGLRMKNATQLQFRDNAVHISSDADGYLNAQADTGVHLNIGGTDRALVTSSGLDVIGAVSGSGAFQIGGTLKAANLGNATVSLTDDLMIIDDGASGAIKTTSLANYATAIAGAGMTSTAGALNVIAANNGGLNVAADEMKVDLNALVAGDFSHGSWYNSTIAFVDVNDSNLTKKESLADFVTKIAGAGLTATNGVLSTQAGAVQTVADGGTLAEGYNYLADISSDATVSLPASPSVGDVVHVKAADLTGGANVIIQKQGSHTIDDDFTSIRIESSFGAVALVYVVANKWRIV